MHSSGLGYCSLQRFLPRVKKHLLHWIAMFLRSQGVIKLFQNKKQFLLNKYSEYNFKSKPMRQAFFRKCYILLFYFTLKPAQHKR